MVRKCLMYGDCIDVYWDEACTETCGEIYWGVLTPGQRKKVTLYVKNTGEFPITGSFNISDWLPPLASEYISLDWNFGDAPLMPGRVRATDFTLTVDSAIHDITDFYFTITLLAVLAPKTGTRLTISIVPTSGYVPFDVVVSGILYDVFATPLIGKTVNLYISGTYYAARTTGGDGKYSFTVTLSTAGTYLFYTEFLGDATYEGCAENLLG